MQRLGMIFLSISLLASSLADDIFITIDADAVNLTQKKLEIEKIEKVQHDIALLKIGENQIENLSRLMHKSFNRCGGFVAHQSKKEAVQVLANQGLRLKAKLIPYVDYSLTEELKVVPMLSQVKEINIREMIIKLSSYHNRHYKSQSGVDSQEYIKKKWEKIASSRNDMRVDLYQHSSWPQPSIVLTLEGMEKKEEVIILGGHGDSIAGWFRRAKARAPGADDNASGIATITEVIRVVADSGYKPQRTIQLISYAAEEVGLLGSQDIANEYKNLNKNVVGVVQFDMTNYKGSKDLDIVFMTDFTNQAQNEFMGSLIDRYLNDVKWGYSQCGYGCSDHASWHNAGFPASMPFESRKRDMNGHIHTSRDTIDLTRSGGTADHAEKFARLGVAFLVEMGK